MKILLIRLDHTGDCVLTVPPLAHAIREAHPEAQVDVLTSKINCRLLDRCEALHDRIGWNAPWSVPPRGQRRTPRWQYLTRGLQFTTLVLPRLVARYNAAIFLSFSPWERLLLRGVAPARCGFSGPYRRWLHRKSEALLSHRVPFDESRHMTENCRQLALAVGLRPATLPPARLVMPETAVRGAWSRLTNFADPAHEWIGVHPGSPSSFKSWPARSFRHLVLELVKRDSTHVFLVASRSELEAADRLCGDLRHPRISAVPTESLFEFACLATHMRRFVANDGGPAHIVAALGVPLVAIFGPTDHRIYAPLGPNVTVVRNATVIEAPCQTPWRVRQPCCEARTCLRSVSVDSVLAALDAVPCLN